MNDRAYVSSTVLRSVKLSANWTKNLRGSGVRRTGEYLVLPALSIVFPVSPVLQTNLLKQRRRFLVPLPRRGGKPLAMGACGLVPQVNGVQNEKHHVQPRFSRRYEEVYI